MLGIRHFDAFMLNDGKYFFGNTDCLKDGVRGFIDNKGEFLNLKETYDVAVKTGQLTECDGSASNYNVGTNNNQTKQIELIRENFLNKPLKREKASAKWRD